MVGKMMDLVEDKPNPTWNNKNTWNIRNTWREGSFPFFAMLLYIKSDKGFLISSYLQFFCFVVFGLGWLVGVHSQGLPCSQPCPEYRPTGILQQQALFFSVHRITLFLVCSIRNIWKGKLLCPKGIPCTEYEIKCSIFLTLVTFTRLQTYKITSKFSFIGVLLRVSYDTN